MFDHDAAPKLPNAAGIGYKAQHFSALTENPGAVAWLEIHAENYMVAGGRQLAQLTYLSETFPISVHGVGLSIGGEGPLDPEHLARLKTLLSRIPVASFSEHLAWSTHDSAFLNDLLPLPYNAESLRRVSDHIDQLQNAIGRQMLLENPSSYLSFIETDMKETEFLDEVAKRTGCGLLLDVNNVFISANNLGYSPQAYIDDFPTKHVGEVHLGGYDEDEDDQGRPLLIDSHGREVSDPVWGLLDYTLAKMGPRPVLIEWDNDVPEFPVLEAEAERATTHLVTA